MRFLQAEALVPLVLVLVLCHAPRSVRAQPGEHTAFYPYGTVDLQLSASDRRALEANRQRRGNSPFNHLQANLFADLVVADRLTIFNQVLVDPSTRTSINAFLRTWLHYPVIRREGFDLNLQVGSLPTPFGDFTERSYTDKNPLLGYPLMYHYASSLRANMLPAGNRDLLAHRGQGASERFTGFAGGGSGQIFAGLPLVYDSCWDFGGAVLGSLWRFEYLVAVTQGTLSDPKTNAVDNNDARSVAVRLGFVPATGLLLRASWGRGAYLDNAVADYLPADREVEDYVQQIAGLAAEYEWRHLAVVGEIAANRWESPYVVDAAGRGDDLEVTGFYLEGRYKVRPGLFAAARYSGLRYGQIDDGTDSGRRVAWDDDADRYEVGIGYWLTDGVLAKLAAQSNDLGPDDSGSVYAADLMVKF